MKTRKVARTQKVKTKASDGGSGFKQPKKGINLNYQKYERLKSLLTLSAELCESVSWLVTEEYGLPPPDKPVTDF